MTLTPRKKREYLQIVVKKKGKENKLMKQEIRSRKGRKCEASIYSTKKLSACWPKETAPAMGHRSVARVGRTKTGHPGI